MINPFESPRTRGLESSRQKPPDRVQFAGWWLVAAGLVQVLLLNYLSGNRGWNSIDWSFMFFSVLGLLILCRLTIAMVITRLVGSLFLVGLFFLIPSVAFVVPQGIEEIRYGPLTIVTPALWQIGLSIFLWAATIVPPWWALQRALDTRSHLNRQTREHDTKAQE